MQNDEKGIYSALGLARKAGKIITGTMACTQAVKKGKVRLVIAAEDTAANTMDKLKVVCADSNTRLITFGQSRMLGMAIGRENIKIIGIIDRNFIKLILSKMQIEWR